MKDALGLKSKSGVHRLITGLEERGFIRRLPHRARALEVTRLSDDQMSRNEQARGGAAAATAGDAGRRGFSANVIRGDFTPSLPGAMVAQTTETVQLPLYGKIAAAPRSKLCATAATRSTSRPACSAAASTTP